MICRILPFTHGPIDSIRERLANHSSCLTRKHAIAWSRSSSNPITSINLSIFIGHLDRHPTDEGNRVSILRLRPKNESRLRRHDTERIALIATDRFLDPGRERCIDRHHLTRLKRLIRIVPLRQVRSANKAYFDTGASSQCL